MAGRERAVARQTSSEVIRAPGLRVAMYVDGFT
jgi:hypothetical protein